MFSPQIVGGTFPSSSTKKVQKGKGKMTEVEIKHEEEDLHETEQDFYLANLSEHDDCERESIVIKEKDSLIKEL